jgi:polar amino acid transport system substrate-binding protein
MLFLAAAACSGCDRTPVASAPAPAPDQPCVLTTGWDPSAPYRYEDARGAVRGVDAEIAALLALDADCELRPVRGDWIDLLARLRAGQVDMLLAATPVAGREPYAWFSQPYRHETFAIYARRDDLPALASMDLQQLVASGRRIGYVRDLDYGGAISDPAGSGHFVMAPTTEANFTRLLAGNVDAVLDDPIAATLLIHRKDWGRRVARHPWQLVRGELTLMFSRQTVPEPVVHRFNRAIAERRADGAIDRIFARYLE